MHERESGHGSQLHRRLLQTALAIPKELGGTGNATNPEQLFAAGWAACFLGAVRRAAAERKVRLASTAITAAIASRMPIPWRSSADVFARILRQRAVEPDDVRDVDTAWDAFSEFLQIEIEGIQSPGDDGDGFIVQWGRWGWNDHRPALSFGRQLAVTEVGEHDDPYWQPEYWQVELQLIFEEDPAWADLDSLGQQDTGFDFDEVGAPRTAALGRIRGVLESYPQLAAMWRAEPIRSDLTLERAG